MKQLTRPVQSEKDERKSSGSSFQVNIHEKNFLTQVFDPEGEFSRCFRRLFKIDFDNESVF